MSNSGNLGFGRSAEDFIRSLEKNRDGNLLHADSGIRIISLSSSHGNRVKARVLVENQSGSEELEFYLLGSLADELSLSIGEIDGNLMSEIERCADVTRAYFSALSSLAFCEGSLNALVRKLVQKGFAREIAEDAVKIVSDRGLIDEKKIIESRIRVFIGKRWGRGRIYAKLREEGFSDSAIRGASVALDEVDFVSLCAEQLRKKHPIIPSDRQGREKIYVSLARYGYSSGEIRAAIALVIDEE